MEYFHGTDLKGNSAPYEKFMWEAIAEGRKAISHCAPNPPVGCVMVRKGRIVAKGHTNPPGEPHAEAMALNKIEGDLSSVSVFVTLEPCSFHGRTPSCATELVKRNVEAVYVGIIDPHPKNKGEGIRLIREAGIPVHVGILEQEILKEIGSYLRT